MLSNLQVHLKVREERRKSQSGTSSYDKEESDRKVERPTDGGRTDRRISAGSSFRMRAESTVRNFVVTL